jgi:hypothetical protein
MGRQSKPARAGPCRLPISGLSDLEPGMKGRVSSSGPDRPNCSRRFPGFDQSPVIPRKPIIQSLPVVARQGCLKHPCLALSHVAFFRLLRSIKSAVCLVSGDRRTCCGRHRARIRGADGNTHSTHPVTGTVTNGNYFCGGIKKVKKGLSAPTLG